MHRETARALASGVLPEEELEEASPVVAAPLAAAQPARAVLAPVALREPAFEEDAQTRAIPRVSEPEHSGHLDGVLSALCEELPAPPQLTESDALTVALEVRLVARPPEPQLDFDEDVEFETDSVDSGAAPTVMRAFEVQAIPLSASALAAADVLAEQLSLEPPADACTRPEPVVLRRSLPPEQRAVLPAPFSEEPARTPTLGSLAALPRLSSERIAELSAVASAQFEEPVTTADQVICSAPNDELTEQMPEVAALSPGVAMVASRKSDVSELLSSFQIGPDDSNQGLCRAIKEMADLDLTPAPFAALIR